MPANKIISGIITIIFTLLLIQGCWSNYELEQRALVSALGVDKGSDGRLLVSAQVVVPSQVSGAQRTTMGRSSGGERPIFVTAVEARTMAEAVSLLSKKVGRTLFYSFMEIIVIGQDLARESITPVADWVARSRELRLRALLGVADGTAREVMESPGAGLDMVPAYYLGSSVKASLLDNSKVVRSDFFDFLNAVSSEAREPVAMRIITSKVSGKKQAQISGSAVFDGYRLAGWLTEIENRGYLWITGQIVRGVISEILPGGKAIAFKIRGSSTSITSDFVDGSPVININIKTKSNVEEVHDVTLKLDKPENLDSLEPIIEDHIAWEVQAALEKARELNTDIFGLGEVIRRQHPAEWKQISKDWKNIFPNVPVEVEVKAALRRTEKAGNPVRPEGSS